MRCIAPNVWSHHPSGSTRPFRLSRTPAGCRWPVGSSCRPVARSARRDLGGRPPRFRATRRLRRPRRRGGEPTRCTSTSHRGERAAVCSSRALAHRLEDSLSRDWSIDRRNGRCGVGSLRVMTAASGGSVASRRWRRGRRDEYDRRDSLRLLRRFAVGAVAVAAAVAAWRRFKVNARLIRSARSCDAPRRARRCWCCSVCGCAELGPHGRSDDKYHATRGLAARRQRCLDQPKIAASASWVLW